MFEHKGLHTCKWHQDPLGRSPMIDFFEVSSDLQSYVLDIRVKRGESRLQPQQFLRQNLGCGKSLERLWRLTCDWLGEDSDKLLGGLGKESSA